MQRSAMTLLEVIASIAVFALITAGVVEAITSMSGMALMHETRHDLSSEAQDILEEIGEDLSRSGWTFPSFDPDDYAGSDPAADRGMLYYPFVLQQSPDWPADPTGSLSLGLPDTAPIYQDATLGSGDNLAHCIRDGADFVRLPDPIPGLPGDPADAETVFHLDPGQDREAYLRSFYARSQELVFLRSLNSDWSRDPNDQLLDRLYFAGESTDWKTPDPDVVDAAVNQRVKDLVDGGMPALQAIETAHAQIREELFEHGKLGVRRMNEFWYRFQTQDPSGANDPSYDPVLDPVTGHPRVIPWDIDRDAAAGTAAAALDTLVSPGAWIERTPDNLFSIEVRWETMVPPARSTLDTDPAGSGDQRIRHSQLRQYTYAVVPSPLDGRAGRLVRAYAVDFGLTTPEGASLYVDRGPGVTPGRWIARDGERAMVIDKVLSDNVMRIVFDTYRTDTRSVAEGRLGLNEVRVRVYLAARYGRIGNRSTTHLAEATFTMRTANNPVSNRRNAEILGTTGLAFPY